jgi:UTP:GlnB (protein PII) uridylyltransferase
LNLEKLFEKVLSSSSVKQVLSFANDNKNLTTSENKGLVDFLQSNLYTFMQEPTLILRLFKVLRKHQKHEYTTLEELKDDLTLLVDSAHRYSGNNRAQVIKSAEEIKVN